MLTKELGKTYGFDLTFHQARHNYGTHITLSLGVPIETVSRIDVDGDKVILRDIMGDERVVEGRILMVDLANSIVKLCCE